LWAGLPDDDERWALSNTLANGRLEGMEPTRDLVEDVVVSAREELDFETFKKRAVRRATRGEGARNAAT
jgi:hypothetical protein